MEDRYRGRSKSSRLAARWGLSGARSVETTERDLKRVFPEETWGRVHLQIIYLGREHCPALYHDLDACPICSWAASKARKEAERRRNLALRRRPGGRLRIASKSRGEQS